MKPFATRTCAALMLSACIFGAVAVPARAELDMIVPPTAEYLPPFSVPKLPAVPGWQSDLSGSLARQARILLPAGKGPDASDALIFARAIAKENTTGLRTVNDLINDDHIATRSRDPGAEITEIPVVTDKAGRKIRLFAERSGDRALYRLKAYSEETDSRGAGYWTLFSLNTSSQTAMAAHADAFQTMLRAYR